MSNPTIKFELVIHYENGTESTHVVDVEDKATAKRRAAKLTKEHHAPVDIAYLDGRPWNERYITTAAESEHHSSGVYFERLS